MLIEEIVKDVKDKIGKMVRSFKNFDTRISKVDVTTAPEMNFSGVLGDAQNEVESMAKDIAKMYEEKKKEPKTQPSIRNPRMTKMPSNIRDSRITENPNPGINQPPHIQKIVEDRDRR